MDKLPEPEFGRDLNWPRLLTGVDPLIQQSNGKFNMYFLGLSVASLFRYYREVTFYKKNYAMAAGVTVGFLFSSYNIAKFLCDDPYVLAAAENNVNEEKFISEYTSLYKNAKEKGLHIPNNLIV
ncbi:hypothetical protein GW820_07100 [archaeon]|nr:hypothetical protein [archaeon]